jgi:FKBP-type peptidyl-prolyl cis-trans isomerase 2
VPRKQIPDNEKIQVGMVLLVSLPNGMQLPARITDANAETITIDLNHPLAGKNLMFKIKLVEVSSGSSSSSGSSKNASASPVEKKEKKAKPEKLEDQFSKKK